MLLCYVIDSGLSTSLLLLATLIIMFYIYITLHYITLHYNGRSLYIVDWLMVVAKGGNVLHHVKRGGIVREG